MCQWRTRTDSDRAQTNGYTHFDTEGTDGYVYALMNEQNGPSHACIATVGAGF